MGAGLCADNNFSEADSFQHTVSMSSQIARRLQQPPKKYIDSDCEDDNSYDFMRKKKVTIEDSSSDGQEKIVIIKKKTERNRLYTDYTNLKVLGRGHFGSVYRATHLLDKIDYAIKVCRSRLELYAMASLAISSDAMLLKHTVRYFTSW